MPDENVQASAPTDPVEESEQNFVQYDLFSDHLGFKIQKLKNISESLAKTAFKLREKDGKYDVMFKNVFVVENVPFQKLAERICNSLNNVLTQQRLGIKKAGERISDAVSKEMNDING